MAIPWPDDTDNYQSISVIPSCRLRLARLFRSSGFNPFYELPVKLCSPCILHTAIVSMDIVVYQKRFRLLLSCFYLFQILCPWLRATHAATSKNFTSRLLLLIIFLSIPNSTPITSTLYFHILILGILQLCTNWCIVYPVFSISKSRFHICCFPT